MAARSTDKERASREAEALALLSSGAGSAYAAQVLAERHGVSLRQGRRYVAAASFELCDAATPAELDRQAMLSLHRLDLVAGRAMQAEDHALAVSATKAHAPRWPSSGVRSACQVLGSGCHRKPAPSCRSDRSRPSA
jgi:hypothetical protein